MDQAKNSAEEVVNKAREKAGEAAGQAQQKAKSQLAQGKDRVADSMESVAQALRSSTHDLQDQQQAGFVGDYMNRAADKVTEISEHLRQRDVSELIHETEDFARREPTIFLAGAFALGLIAARFLKSSGSTMQQGYSGSQQWAGNAGYSEDYEQDSYIGAYDRDASTSFNESGMSDAAGASSISDQPFGGSASMPGSGVMGDGPFTTGAGGAGDSGNRS
jgi:hypothetical protein